MACVSSRCACDCNPLHLSNPHPNPNPAGWLPRRLGGGLGDTRKARPSRRANKFNGPGWVRAPIGGSRLLCNVETKAAAIAARAAKSGGEGGTRDR